MICCPRTDVSPRIGARPTNWNWAFDPYNSPSKFWFSPYSEEKGGILISLRAKSIDLLNLHTWERYLMRLLIIVDASKTMIRYLLL